MSISDNANIKSMNRADLEQHYEFILNSLAVLIRRAGGTVVLNDDDVEATPRLERLWIKDLRDAKNGLRLSLKPHGPLSEH